MSSIGWRWIMLQLIRIELLLITVVSPSASFSCVLRRHINLLGLMVTFAVGCFESSELLIMSKATLALRDAPSCQIQLRFHRG